MSIEKKLWVAARFGFYNNPVIPAAIITPGGKSPKMKIIIRSFF